MKNILTIDLEFWYDVLEVSREYRNKLERRYGKRLNRSLDPLLNILDQHDSKATFFVVGSLAKHHPNCLKKLQARGHEIALHGNVHRKLTDFSPEQVRNDIRIGSETLQSLTNEQPMGFRAPGWSINKSNRFVLDVLSEAGFSYDSSLSPWNANRLTYNSNGAVVQHVKTPRGNILEIPPSPLNKTFFRVPLAAGWSFRILPFWIIKKKIQSLNAAGEPAVLALHSWDFDRNQPRIRWPFPLDFAHNYGLSTSKNRLKQLLSSFRFCSVRTYLNKVA